MTEFFAQVLQRRQMQSRDALLMLNQCPGADTDTRRRLLSMASRALPDPEIVARWIELALAETDTRLQEEMIVRLLNLDFRQIPAAGRWIELLEQGVQRDSLRPFALHALGKLVPSFPAAVDVLKKAYQSQKSATAQREILLAMVHFDTPPDRLVQFLLSLIENVDEDIKELLVPRLLRRNAVGVDVIKRWLLPTEPLAVRRYVLDYLADHADVRLPSSLCQVLVSDTDRDCRYYAVEILGGQGPFPEDVVLRLLDSAQTDPDASIRAACLRALKRGSAPDEGVIRALTVTLHTEGRSKEVIAVVLDILIPLIPKSRLARESVLKLLNENPSADLASAIALALGTLARGFPESVSWMAELYTSADDDRFRTTLLEILSAQPDPDSRMVQFYRQALSAPTANLRTWAAAGLLQVPMTSDQLELFAEAFDLLLDRRIDSSLRERLAHKIARLPRLSPGTLPRLQKLVEQSTEERFHQVLQTAFDRLSRDSASAVEVDWAHWLHRVEVEHHVEGIFPEIYAQFKSHREKALEILKIAVLNPQCGNSLYQAGVSSEEIVQFLMAEEALDDDLRRYALEKVRSDRPSNFYLNVFKDRGDFPGLKEAIFDLIDRDPGDINAVLLREILLSIFKDDDKASAELSSHISRTTMPKALASMVDLLTENALWAPAPALLRQMVTHPLARHEDVGQKLEEAFRHLAEPMPAPSGPTGPGFADD